MNTRLLLTILVLFLNLNLSLAKDRYVDCQIKMVDGSEKKCLIKLPMSATADRLVVKQDQNSSKKTIIADKVKYIIISNNGVDVIYERTPYERPKAKKSNKTSKYSAFLKIILACENIYMYSSYAELDIDRQGNLMEMYIDGMGGQLLKRKNEKFPCLVGYTFLDPPKTQKGFDKQRKKMLEKYFSNDSSVLKDLNGRESVSEKDVNKLANSICE